MLKKFIKRIYLCVYNKKNDVTIKSTYASPHAKYGKKVLIDIGTFVGANVSIGDYSYINKYSSAENCCIGKYCSISSGVYIAPFEHCLEDISTHPAVSAHHKEASRQKPVNIGNDVLISLNAVILGGVTIGDGAVVAAGAVVTNDIKPYEIVGGVPAKHIGYRTSKSNIEVLKKIRWWDWSEKKIKAKSDFFLYSLSKELPDIKNIEDRNE